MPNSEAASSYSDEFNRQSKERLAAHVRELRRGLIQDVFRVFQEFQIEDVMVRERPNVGRYTLWLTTANDEIPMLPGGEGQSSMAFAVQNSAEPKERLRFHVPVPEDFDADNVEAVADLAEPREIYAERVLYTARGIGQTTVRYAIDQDHTYLYRTASDTQNEEEINAVDVWAEFDREYDPGITLIGDLSTDLIRWQAVKQQLIITSAPGRSAQSIDI